MKGVWRWLFRGTLALLLLLALALAGAWIWQRSSLPQTEGTLALHGLKATVTVTRDQWGIPTIRAESEADALFALGFVHAQDRLFQMDFTRRLGAGRLSQVVGEATVSIDRLMRTLDLHRVAAANLQQLSPEARAALDSYVAGVNAYIDSHEGPWPMEFYILAYRPDVWTAADSLVWGRLMALQLSLNYGQELLRSELAPLLTPQEIQQLFPDYPADGPVATQDLARLDPDALRQLGSILPWMYGPKSASNAWALSSARSATGGALLANDPHLGLQEPGWWYLARLEFAGRVLAGATAPGVPYMVIGRNDTLAWSFTTTHGDTQDLFIETLDPTDAGRYLTKDGPQPFETRQENIAVDGGSPVRFTVRETYHGPVMNDALPETAKVVAENQVLTLAWTGLREDDRSGEALYRLNRATDVAEALEALRDLHSPQQSMILADAEGHITLTVPGRVPVRAKGDGTVPVPGANGEFDWTGFVPYEELPRLSDPASGQLVTANNKAVPDDYPHLIAAEWYFPTRAQRIAEVLRAKQVQDLQDMAALQYDSLSIGARELLPILLPMAAASGEAVDLLSRWDYVMDRDRPEPLIYSAWIKALEQRLLADQVGGMLPELVSVLTEQSVKALIRPDSLFCDDTTTADTIEDCAAAVRASLDDALQALSSLYGDDPADWRWGEAHRARFDHQFLQYVPLLGDLIAYDLPTNGGQDTVNRGASPLYQPMPGAFRHRHGAGLRAVFDMANPDASLFVIATGQSGNPLSPHYGDQAPLWQQGQSVTLAGTPPDQGETLTLNPR
jgi:penicillin G amidase